MSKKNGTVLLCILDGVGIGPNEQSNALFTAKTPTLDHLHSQHPHSQLRSDGEYVGVPQGQMGNSEIGHITIGTGRVVQQSLVKISSELENNKFENNKNYHNFLNDALNSPAVHLLGLVSNGGIHSHMGHCIAICKLLNTLNKPIFVHVITDGRDTDVNAAIEQIKDFENQIKDLINVEIASIVGRYYAMDRDNRWERIEAAWKLFTEGQGASYDTACDAIQSAYDAGLSDEHIKPSFIKSRKNLDGTIKDQDALFLFNFRGDRMRQLTRCFLNMEGVDFKYDPLKLSSIAAMTQYDAEFKDKCHTIYPPELCKNSLGETISHAGLKQLRIAETEKYAHVTFFFNNGRELPFDQEDRILIPSPREVKTYDEKPQMSLPELTTKLTSIIESQEYDFIALNIANADMVGHTGNFTAATQAVEHIDTALKKITSSIKSVNGEMLIIADHGNIEQMTINDKPSTTHSTNPVPCIYYGHRNIKHIHNGGLADVGPTILYMLDLDIPEEMTGKVLISES